LLTDHFAFGKQRANKLRVEPMATSVSHHLADNFTARKGKVAYQIECFVSNAFIFESQYVSQRALVSEDHHVGYSDSRPETASPEPLGLGFE
jgi:hypothetical protein